MVLYKRIHDDSSIVIFFIAPRPLWLRGPFLKNSNFTDCTYEDNFRKQLFPLDEQKKM